MYVNCAILPLKNQKDITEMLGDQPVNGQEAELSPSLALSIAALAKASGAENKKSPKIGHRPFFGARHI